MSTPGNGARRAVSSGRGAPPPRRGAGAPPLERGGGAATAALPTTEAPAAPRTPIVTSPTDRDAGAETPRSHDGASSAAANDAAPRPPWWLRVLAWVVAIPLGLLLVAYPARKLGYLSSQRLLDVLIGDSVRRYVPLVVIVVLWALVTAFLVQGIIEGMCWLRRGRTTRAATDADG